MPKVEEIFKTLTSCGIAQETQSFENVLAVILIWARVVVGKLFVESVYK